MPTSKLTITSKNLDGLVLGDWALKIRGRLDEDPIDMLDDLKDASSKVRALRLAEGQEEEGS